MQFSVRSANDTIMLLRDVEEAPMAARDLFRQAAERGALSGGTGDDGQKRKQSSTPSVRPAIASPSAIANGRRKTGAKFEANPAARRRMPVDVNAHHVDMVRRPVQPDDVDA